MSPKVSTRRRAQRRRVQYRIIPVWVARITEEVHVNGKRYMNVVTKTGKPRTILMRENRVNSAIPHTFE
jgi:hypothetical protein